MFVVSLIHSIIVFVVVFASKSVPKHRFCYCVFFPIFVSIVNQPRKF